MRLGEKEPVTVNGNIGRSSVSLADLPGVNEVSVSMHGGSLV